MIQSLKFEKMQGCGNDFVVLDARKQLFKLTPPLIKKICDRRFGIGCDQLIYITKSQDPNCDAHYQFFNPDSSEAEQCGNGQRCIAWYLHMQNPHRMSFKVSGLAGVINSTIIENNIVKVNIGNVTTIVPKRVNDIKVYEVQLANPHLVIPVENVSNTHLEQVKKDFSPEVDVNVEIFEILNENHIKIRVHERGTGETLACGSGACAAVLALQSDELVSDKVNVSLPGGDLVVEYQQQNQEIYLTGLAKQVFSGVYQYDK